MITAPRSCASCDVSECAMNHRHGVTRPLGTRISFVMDDAWPEYASLVASTRGAEDRLLSPGLLGIAGLARYRWPDASHHAAFATVRRHLAMWRVARISGDVRQQSYLKHDRAVAHALAKAIDYRSGHLVIAQSWLPWLDEAGVLGGRSFDVVMSRYPFAELHRRLDTAAAEMETSGTISDFRASPALVAREAALLAQARTLYTPHHDIAALFPDRARRLAWHKPAPSGYRKGTRTAFLGPTIARQRPDRIRAAAQSLDAPLIVFGALIEPAFWEGIAIERRAIGPGWLDDVGTILHPATVTSQPRLLLHAVANGVVVRATSSCGLAPADFQPLDAL